MKAKYGKAILQKPAGQFLSTLFSFRNSLAEPLRLKAQDSEPLSKYLPRKVLPISPGRLVPDAYSEGSLRVAQAQPDFPTIRRSDEI
jgi:hypothetical protein